MNKTLTESLGYARELLEGLPEVDDRIQSFVIPPFTSVREVKAALAATRVKVGAQNTHWEDSGAWTGEISPLMLTDCGLDLVEIGHSERREHFGETNRTVGLKTAATLRHGLIPLICIGETLDDRESGRAESVLAGQVRGALAFLENEGRQRPLLFAYEPVWAIGERGIPASADYAGKQQRLIRDVGSELLPSPPPVLYGGSVNADNVVELIAEDGIDGLFIGRAAWTAAGYLRILRLVGAALRGKDNQEKDVV